MHCLAQAFHESPRREQGRQRERQQRAQVHSGFVAPSPAFVAVIQGRGGYSRCASAINAYTETLVRLSCSLQSWSAPVCQDLRLHFGEETLKHVLELIRCASDARWLLHDVVWLRTGLVGDVCDYGGGGEGGSG